MFALQTNKFPLLATQIQQLGNTCRVVLQWIPAHCGLPGNESADQLAKCGAQEEQPSTSIHYQEKTTIIKTALKHRQEKDAYHLLDRPGHVVLVRLRSGHNRLNAHMHRKLNIVPSPNVSLWWGGPDNRARSSETKFIIYAWTPKSKRNNETETWMCLENLLRPAHYVNCENEG